MATWDVFHADRLEVERALSTDDVRAALDRGDLGDDDLIRPAGTTTPWARIGDSPSLLELVPEPEPSPPPRASAPPPPPQASSPPSQELPSWASPLPPVPAPTPPTTWPSESPSQELPSWASPLPPTPAPTPRPSAPPPPAQPSRDAAPPPAPTPPPRATPPPPPPLFLERTIEDFGPPSFPDDFDDEDEEEEGFPIIRDIPEDSEPIVVGDEEFGRDDPELFTESLEAIVLSDSEWDEFEDEYDPQDEDEEAAEFTLSRGAPEKIEELDLAAMVDVAFQLVLFFLVTATSVLYKSLEVPKPNPDSPAAAATQGRSKTLDDLKDDYILVEIDPGGAMKIDREPVAADMNKIVERLRSAREATHRKSMLLTADFVTPHRNAVLAYDAANEIGLGIAIARPSGEEPAKTPAPTPKKAAPG